MDKYLINMPRFFRGAGVWAEHGPLYLMMNFPTSCSLHCPKCSVPDRKSFPNALTREERRQIMAAASAAGILALVVIGMGEPMENPEIMMPAIEDASDAGLGTILFSTLSRMDQEMARFYAKHYTTIFMSLDSLKPDLYRKLTGGGDLVQAICNLGMLKATYVHEMNEENGGESSLAINMTVSNKNVGEVERIKKLADNFGLFFLADAPMPHGRLAHEKLWEQMIAPGRLTRRTPDSFGPEWERLREVAEAHTDRDPDSPFTEALCGYYNHGVSVHFDGSWLGPCAYGTESAGLLGNARGSSAQDILAHYERMRTHYDRWITATGRSPACPLRDPAFPSLISTFKTP